MQFRTPGSRLRTRHAFTLIELLTVIAIIGVLAAIIIPTVGKVRNTAKKAQCVGRLRQWGTIVSLCANDYRTNVPLFFKNDAGFIFDPYITKGRGMIVESEKDGISRSLRPTEAFTVCPTGISGGNTVGGTRQYNFVVPVGLKKKNPRIFGLTSTNEEYYYRQSDASAPAQLILMIEMNDNARLDASDPGNIEDELDKVRKIQKTETYIRHGGLANALFLDGHVASLTTVDTDYAASREKLIRWFTL
jgi:prepilin-type N-terminal cleavage/methylation domain-containing protein/prepilin-type processing-associated H-X9-DG protein